MNPSRASIVDCMDAPRALHIVESTDASPIFDRMDAPTVEIIRTSMLIDLISGSSAHDPPNLDVIRDTLNKDTVKLEWHPGVDLMDPLV